MNILLVLKLLLIAATFAHSVLPAWGLAGQAPSVLYVSEDKDVSDPGNKNLLFGPPRQFPFESQLSPDGI